MVVSSTHMLLDYDYIFCVYDWGIQTYNNKNMSLLILDDITYEHREIVKMQLNFQLVVEGKQQQKRK